MRDYMIGRLIDLLLWISKGDLWRWIPLLSNWIFRNSADV